MKRNFTCLTLLLILAFAVALPSCKKFEGPQKVPAYIHIESIEVDPNPENYFVSFVPIHLNFPLIIVADAISYGLIMLLLLIPTLFISRVDPAQTVRAQ